MNTSRTSISHAPRRTGLFAGLASGGLAAAIALMVVAGSQPAYAAEAKVGLGTASSFAVLAGTTVTNTGPTVVSGDLGVSPGTAITGFPPGQVIGGGARHEADAVALQAQNDLTTAYNDAAGRTPATSVGDNLGGQTLVGGAYQTAAAMALTGTVTLDAQGDPNTVWIFQAGSTLTTATSSTVALINGAQACNVYWQVGSSATLGTDTVFNGTIMALTTATLQTRASVAGRVLARNGAVNLDNNTITRPGCTVGPTATATTGVPTATATTGGPTPTTTRGPTGTASPTPGTPSGPATSTETPGGPGTSTETPGGPGTPGRPPGAGAPPAAGSPPGYKVPVGNPDTGRDGTGLFGAPAPESPVWFALGLLTLGASGLAGAEAWRRSRATDPTR